MDVYSFGVIMWEVCSHEQPARGRMRDLKVPQECPAEIDALITRCLSENPEQRPTAKEAYDILKDWRDRHADFLMNRRTSTSLDRPSLERPSCGQASNLDSPASPLFGHALSSGTRYSGNTTASTNSGDLHLL